jgi:glucose-1-phosphate cytidylyltransferase
MVAIDGRPILWHLMNIFALQGYKEFVIAGGYKSEVIEEWISQSKLYLSEYRIELIDTGLSSQTGDRVQQIMTKYPLDRFIMTYGDGLGNVSIDQLLKVHDENRRLITLTAVHPPARFGHLDFIGNQVTNFSEKVQSDAGWINGGFMVIEPNALKKYYRPNSSLESDILPSVAKDAELSVNFHSGFWQPMDTLREKKLLDELAIQETPPWIDLQ